VTPLRAGDGSHVTETQPDPVRQWWTEFKETDSREIRDRLILHYAPLVKYVVGRMAAGLPPNVDQSDLASYGILGLIDAIERFDPGRDIKFETYAISRVKGAIIDELRSMDWVPRSLRRRARELEEVYGRLEREAQRAPTDEEVARALGVSADEYSKILSDLGRTSVVALDELIVGDKGDGISVLETIEDRSGDPSSLFELEEMKDLLGEAIRKLPEREKLVVALYYYQGLTLKEIGSVLGVTESRASQLHTKAVLRLRGGLRTAGVVVAD